MEALIWLPDFELRTVHPLDDSPVSVEAANSLFIPKQVTGQEMIEDQVEGVLISQVVDEKPPVFIDTDEIDYYQTDGYSTIIFFLKETPDTAQNVRELRTCLSCTEFIPSKIFATA